MKRGVHIRLDPDTVRAIDEFAGHRGRSAYIARAVRQHLNEARRIDPDDLWAPERALWTRYRS